jgi:hypothetical protein
VGSNRGEEDQPAILEDWIDDRDVVEMRSSGIRVGIAILKIKVGDKVELRRIFNAVRPRVSLPDAAR